MDETTTKDARLEMYRGKVDALEQRVKELETNLFAATATVASLEAKLRQVEDGLAGKGELNMTRFKLCNPITVQQVDSPTHMRQLEEGALIFLEDVYASISGPPNVDAPITWEEERYRTLQNKMRLVEEERDRLREALREVEMELEGRYDGTLDSPTRWMGSLLLCIEQALKEERSGR